MLHEWMVGWRVGEGIPPSFLSWRNGELPGGIRCCSNVMKNRFIFHPSKVCCVWLCGVCGVYNFVMWDGAQLFCVWVICVLDWYFAFYDIHYLGNSARESRELYMVGHSNFFPISTLRSFPFQKRTLRSFRAFYSGHFFEKDIKNALMYIQWHFRWVQMESFLLLTTLPPPLLVSTKS